MSQHQTDDGEYPVLRDNSNGSDAVMGSPRTPTKRRDGSISSTSTNTSTISTPRMMKDMTQTWNDCYRRAVSSSSSFSSLSTDGSQQLRSQASSSPPKLSRRPFGSSSHNVSGSVSGDDDQKHEHQNLPRRSSSLSIRRELDLFHTTMTSPVCNSSNGH